MDTHHALVARLQRYVASTLPLVGDLRPHPQHDALPLGFRTSHVPLVGTVGTRTLTFLITTVGAPAAAARAAAQVGRILQTSDIVLVTERLTAAQRRGLIAAHTAFIVPDAHLWLPMLSMLFCERSPPPPPAAALQPATQALLVHWYHHGVDSCPTLAQAARTLGYSTMTMSRAFTALAARQPPGLRIERHQRERRCVSTLARQDLWNAYAHFATSPVVETVLARRSPSLDELPLAGISALAACSDLAPPPITIRALDVVRRRQSRWQLSLVEAHEEPDDAVVQLEIWAYPARLHDEASPTVEPLSLALSLSAADREDPRVAQALRAMGAIT